MNAPLHNKEKSSSDEKPEKLKNEQESTAPQSRTSTYDLSKATHPIVCFLALALKIAAILW